MWETILAAATNAADQPPEVPSEPIGVILVALITGATAIAVALIQRNRRDTTSATPVFAVPEGEWVAVRDRTVRIESALEHLDRLVQGHIRECDKDLDKFREDLANVKGQLGIR